MENTANNNGHKEGEYTSPNGRVRAFYRTYVTGEDQFEREFLEARFLTEDRIQMAGSDMAKFCLNRFVNRLELLDEDGKVVDTFPFTWEVMTTKVVDVYAEGGWFLQLALKIHNDVLKVAAQRAEDLKKASPGASEVCSGERPPESKTPMESPTSS